MSSQLTHTADQSLPRVRPLYLIALGWFCVSLILLIVQRSQWILQFEYPLASDAYFYLQEFDHRLSSGEGYYTSASPFFVVTSSIASLLALTPLQTFHLLIFCALALFSIALARLSFELELGLLGKSVLALSVLNLFWGSDILFFRHYAFVKQGLAIALLVLGISISHPQQERPERSMTQVVGYFLVALAALFHLFSAGIAMLYLITKLIVSKDRRWLGVVSLSIVVVAGFTYLSFNPKSILELPAAPLQIGWLRACEFAECSPFEYREFQLYTLLAIAGLVFAATTRTRQPISWLFWVIVLLLNLPVWTSEGHMAYRLAYASVWIALIAYTFSLRAVIRLEKHLGVLFAIAISITFLTAKTTLAKRSYKGLDQDPAILAELRQPLQSWIPKDAFILAPHGVQFRMTYFLKRSSAKELPTSTNYSSYYVMARAGRKHRGCYVVRDPQAAIPVDTRCVRLSKRWVIERLSKKAS